MSSTMCDHWWHFEANDDIQDEQHAIFQCTYPLSPQKICSSIHSDRISEIMSHDVSAFLNQSNIPS